MLMVITGGSGSGKSAFAEEKAVMLAAGGPLAYLATMQVYGEEGRRKVERHRQLRDGKGFVTIERTTRAERRILETVERLYAKCRNLVIVTGEVASDGISYEEGTENYIRLLERVNCGLCRKADAAYEVVYGIPVCLKGKEIL